MKSGLAKAVVVVVGALGSIHYALNGAYAQGVVKMIPVGKSPSAVVISLDTKTLYVANQGDSSVSVVDAQADRMVATISVGRGPSSLAITPDGSKVYVTNAEEGTVSVIDTKARRVSNTIKMVDGIQPSYIAVTPNGKKAYVSNVYGTRVRFQGNVNVIYVETNEVRSTISNSPAAYKSIGCPEGIGVTPNGRWVYLNTQCLATPGRRSHDPIFVVDVETDTVIKWIVGDDIPNVGSGIAVRPDGKQVWAGGGDACTAPHTTYDKRGCGAPGGNPVTIIDSATNRVVKQLFYNSFNHMAFSANSKSAFLATDKEILVIDTTTFEVKRRLAVGGSTGSMVFSRDGVMVYTPIRNENALAVIKLR